MNWSQVEGKWHQFKGSLQQKWGQLTDDDLDEIRGQQEILMGKIQERYGKTKEEARREVEDWVKGLE
ncbi:MAG: CsbD family protein [Anaerolineae bacterium]